MRMARSRSRIRNTNGPQRGSKPVLENLEQRVALTTFHVTSAADSGNGTLRDAISLANSHLGADIIDFSIGTGAQSIALTSALPAIGGPVTIDATTQPGYTGTPLIELNGTGAGLGSNGLFLTGGNTTVKGLIIDHFNGSGIRIDTAGNDTIQNCFIGVGPDGTTAAGNQADGITIIGGKGSVIGGTTAAARNVISGNAAVGVRISGANTGFNSVVGNYIGTNAAGTGAVGNTFDGVTIDGSGNNVVGGLTAASRNVISGNGAVGVRLVGTSAKINLIAGNAIGTQANGTSALGNHSNGVFIASGATQNVIGGLAAGAANVIDFNAGAGVATLQSAGNAILSNSIFGNSFLGIDINSDGLTTTNLPTLISAVRLGSSSIVQGTIQSTPGTTLVLQFFANTTTGPAGYGEGQTLIGTAGVVTDASGKATFKFTFPTVLQPGQWVTADATDANLTTWEFSQRAPYQFGTQYDFDGDGKADPAVFQRDIALWTILQSTAGKKTALLGEANVDVPIAFDWDTDGKTDLALFRPPFAQWLIQGSRAGGFGFNFGTNGDIPAPADFDGDGKLDAAFFRPSNHSWFILFSSGGGLVFPQGQTGDVPEPADYDGDGKADLAVYRPTTGQWFIRPSNGSPAFSLAFGVPGIDRPIPGDFDGDGRADIAVYRPTTGEWFIIGTHNGIGHVTFGAPNLDLPVPSDYDGDGRLDIAVFRPTTSEFLILPSSGGIIDKVVGAPGQDLPVNLPIAYRVLNGLLPFDTPRPSSTASVASKGAGVTSGSPDVIAPIVPSADVVWSLPGAKRKASAMLA